MRPATLRGAAAALFIGCLQTPVFAGGPVKAPITPMQPIERSPFEKGRFELQSGLGAFWGFSPDGSERDTINYMLSTYRLGVMLNDPAGDGWYRGNFQFMVEGFYGSVFEGPGDSLAGGSLILRYNFVQPESRWFPYVQIGAGGLWNDIHEDREQVLIGSEFEFILQASIGLRYQISPKWGIAVEGGYRHISNADTDDRNRGLDSLGGLVGLVYSF